MKILLAIDGSECGEAAVAEVGRLPWPEGSEIRVVTAAEMPFYPALEFGTLPQPYFEELETSIRQRARKVVDDAVGKLAATDAVGAAISGDVQYGTPREVIVEEATRWGADLIVVGSHGYHGYKRFLLGSVSQSVAAHAPCSVLIVRAAR